MYVDCRGKSAENNPGAVGRRTSLSESGQIAIMQNEKPRQTFV
uniref:Uncharacterized protein n=1 Tax=Siphoviridae sp. ctBLh2 TaxID=2827803 RepID=A0A8S5S4I2_9CAUD|nr:MAG TPA: hypothetical protein [Siphoviridae sp. ctBLh2]